jgi:hypothetical protein
MPYKHRDQNRRELLMTAAALPLLATPPFL